MTETKLGSTIAEQSND